MERKARTNGESGQRGEARGGKEGSTDEKKQETDKNTEVNIKGLHRQHRMDEDIRVHHRPYGRGVC